MAPRVNKWIQKAKPKPGALHRQMGYPVDQPIPPNALQRAGEHGNIGKQVHGKTITPLMWRRARFAINAQVRRAKKR